MISRERIVLSASRISADLVFGPAVLVFANLIDLYLATRVFTHADRLAGSLAFFIFGAATGVPMQLFLSRSAVAARLERRTQLPSARHYDKKAAAFAGALSALATATWLYCLTSADPALIFPLANMAPLLFAIVESARGHVSLSHVLLPVLVLVGGFWTMRMPAASSLLAVTPAVVIALLLRNFASAGAEAVERAGASGRISRFSATRFVWLAAAGLPLAIAVVILTGRGSVCIDLIAKGWIVALPLHAMTMLLTFIGIFYRTRAKAEKPLTLCTAAYATPLIVAPLVAAVMNLVARGFFPTVTASFNMVLSAFLVVTGVAWLATNLQRARTNPSLKGDSHVETLLVRNSAER